MISDKKLSGIIIGSAWALTARVFSTCLILISSMVVARGYGADILGTVAIINSLLMILTAFTVFGINTSILRLIPEHIGKYSPKSAFKVYKKSHNIVTGFSVVAGILLFLYSSILSEKVFANPNLSFILSLASIFLVFRSLMELNTQAIRSLQLIRSFAIIQLLPGLSNLLILIGLSLFSFNQHNPIYALFVSFLVTTVAGFSIVQFRFKKIINPSDTVRNMPTKKILSISFPMLMTATMSLIMGQMGVILLGVFRSETEAGYYDISVKLSNLTTFVLTAINTIVAPTFSELFHSGKMNELFYIAKKTAKLIFWATTPILLSLIVFGKPILTLLFGCSFKAAYGAMVLLVIGQFLNSISGSVGYFMNMTNNQNSMRNIMLCAAILNLALCLILIPRFGIIGAAVSGMTSLFFWNIITLLYIKWKYNEIIGYLPGF